MDLTRKAKIGNKRYEIRIDNPWVIAFFAGPNDTWRSVIGSFFNLKKKNQIRQKNNKKFRNSFWVSPDKHGVRGKKKNWVTLVRCVNILVVYGFYK